ATAPSESKVNQAYQIFRQHIGKVEYLVGYEGNEFSFSGNIVEDILSITAVHPMREDAILEYLRNVDAEFSVIDEMISSGRLIVTEYRGKRFYLRNLKR
ncbi:MAG: radical SAM protein, partial [Desulfuromusa sp.]|nr:radical SAM protein [Desulfuromusa sp.]